MRDLFINLEGEEYHGAIYLKKKTNSNPQGSLWSRIKSTYFRATYRYNL